MRMLPTEIIEGRYDRNLAKNQDDFRIYGEDYESLIQDIVIYLSLMYQAKPEKTMIIDREEFVKAMNHNSSRLRSKEVIVKDDHAVAKLESANIFNKQGDVNSNFYTLFGYCLWVLYKEKLDFTDGRGKTRKGNEVVEMSGITILDSIRIISKPNASGRGNDKLIYEVGITDDLINNLFKYFLKLGIKRETYKNFRRENLYSGYIYLLDLEWVKKTAYRRRQKEMAAGMSKWEREEWINKKFPGLEKEGEVELGVDVLAQKMGIFDDKNFSRKVKRVSKKLDSIQEYTSLKFSYSLAKRNNSRYNNTFVLNFEGDFNRTKEEEVEEKEMRDVVITKELKLAHADFLVEQEERISFQEYCMREDLDVQGKYLAYCDGQRWMYGQAFIEARVDKFRVVNNEIPQILKKMKQSGKI